MSRPGPGERAAERFYRGLWRVLVDWFRVPDRPPTLPIAPGEESRSFQPDRGFLDYLKLWFWIVSILVDVAILVAWIVITVVEWWVGLLLLPLALVLALAPDVVAYVALHLRYDTTWYVMTERSLRIRRGIWIIHEMTITFENVQNVKVTQGPVQRLFGISSVTLETAGGGGESRGGRTAVANRGIIEGVADPRPLRELILARLRASRQAGLGDEDEAEAPAHSPWTPAHLATLREIGAAVRTAGVSAFTSARESV